MGTGDSQCYHFFIAKMYEILKNKEKLFKRQINKGSLKTKCGINRCTHEAEEHSE